MSLSYVQRHLSSVHAYSALYRCILARRVNDVAAPIAKRPLFLHSCELCSNLYAMLSNRMLPLSRDPSVSSWYKSPSVPLPRQSVSQSVSSSEPVLTAHLSEIQFGLLSLNESVIVCNCVVRDTRSPLQPPDRLVRDMVEIRGFPRCE